MTFSSNEIIANAAICNKNQVKILEYMDKNGFLILEHVYKKLEIPKPTVGHHIKQLEARGLIEVVNVNGNTKPRKLTSFGKAVISFLNDEVLSEEDRIKIFIVDLLLDLDINKPDESEIMDIVNNITYIIDSYKNSQLKNIKESMVV